MKTCPAGFSFCSRCHLGKTNGHGPGRRPGDPKPLTLDLSAEEVELVRRAIRDLRSRAQKSEAKLKEKFGEKTDTTRSQRTQLVAKGLQERISEALK